MTVLISRKVSSKYRQWRSARKWRAGSIDCGPAVEGRYSQTNIGVSLVLLARWNGKLLAQVVYTWSLLEQLDARARRCTFMSFFKRPGKSGRGPGGPDGESMPDCLAQRAPTLGHFLCDEVWPDGECKSRSSLVVFVEDGLFKACLTEKDSNSVLWASCKSFDELLESLEARLTDDQPDWRKGRPRKK